MRRPLVSARIDDLERLFSEHGEELAALQALEQELAHRSTYRATQLKAKVAKALAPKRRRPKDPLAKKSPRAGGGRHRSAPGVPTERKASAAVTSESANEVVLSIKLAWLEFSGRARTVIDGAGLTYVGDLARLDTSKLYRLPNVGRRTVEELTQGLSRLGLQIGEQYSNWTPSLGAELEDRARRWLSRRSGANRHKQLVAALMADIRSVEPETRNVAIIAEQVGCDGDGGRTLEAVGDKYGLTRERVRQIVARAGKRLRQRGIAPKALLDALKLAQSLAPATDGRLAEALQREGLADGMFTAESLANVATWYGLRLLWDVAQVHGQRAVVPKNTGDQLRTMAQRAVRTVSGRGCCDLQSLASDFAPFDTRWRPGGYCRRDRGTRRLRVAGSGRRLVLVQ